MGEGGEAVEDGGQNNTMSWQRTAKNEQSVGHTEGVARR